MDYQMVTSMPMPATEISIIWTACLFIGIAIVVLIATLRETK